MKSRELALTLQDIRIRAWLYCPDDSFRGLRPVVVFCHGIPGGSPDPADRGYLALVKELGREGYCSVLFNFRGCGLSDGSIDMHGWYDDLCAVVCRVYNTPGIDPSAIHCIAFSAGGAVAARYAAMEKHLQSLLLMATPENFRDILPEDPLALKEHFLQIGVIRDEQFPPDLTRWYDDFLDLRPGAHLPFVSPRPVGIVHGENDETVPPGHAARLFDAACHPKKLIMLPQAAHQLRKDPRVLPIIKDWLKQVR
ncbi:MAG: alpha/beta fold hydrolase [Desulfomonilia bacterium]|jgi:pimeloyl-ACP methyl ester carboxylesterase|nr:alpha/beta hydrolase [Deltaproteobacteria bacterium]MDX9760511.1 alpha/beta fold hydrolase [Desulfomonilia bacterium]HPW68889.1 alpha/beta fold hydrolase [Deltaproteobacteria bacterium]